MARKPMVTRTVKVTHAECLWLNVETGESERRIFDVTGTVKDDAKLLSKVKALYDAEDGKIVHIYGSEVEEILYGMTEEKFVAGADVLPNRK